MGRNLPFEQYLKSGSGREFARRHFRQTVNGPLVGDRLRGIMIWLFRVSSAAAAQPAMVSSSPVSGPL
jgi:hypothetical protein